jgi:DNA-binding NarL/FixJ family response regulator
MAPNHYEPVLDKWKSELIAARARRMGFRDHDLLDAQQEVALAVMLFRFDLAKSNGAAETTALTALIDRQLKTMLRAKVRYDRCVQRAGQEHTADAAHNDLHSLVIDVRDAVDRLTPAEQAVCRGLGCGDSIDQIAYDMGRGWHTIRRIIERIRVQLSAIGLDAWLVRG